MMNARKGLLGKITNSRGQSKKLKKKIVYVYESDSDEDNGKADANPYISIKDSSKPLPSIARNRDVELYQGTKM